MADLKTIGTSLDRNFRNDINDNFKSLDNSLSSSSERIDEQLKSIPQPSEIVDIRVDAEGKVYATAKKRIDALQREIQELKQLVLNNK